MYNNLKNSMKNLDFMNKDKMKSDAEKLGRFERPEDMAILGATTDKTSADIQTNEDAQAVLPKKESSFDWKKLAQVASDSADASDKIMSRPIEAVQYGDVGRGVEIPDAMAAKRAALEKFLRR